MRKRPASAPACANGSVSNVIDRNLFERYGDVQAFGVNAAAWEPTNWKNPSETNPLIQAMNAYMTNYGLYKLMLFVDLQGNVTRSGLGARFWKPVGAHAAAIDAIAFPSG